MAANRTTPLPEAARRCWYRYSAGLFLTLCLAGTETSISVAQLSPITPSGLNSQVSAPIVLPNGGNQYNITAGTRAGTNVFHSFGSFNVPTNNIANFLNDTPSVATANILGRVTGGNLSNIFGTIQTTGFGSANLFLMNPAGFLFGPTATVNVQGMATFTTADYLRLSDGTKNGYFYANPDLTSVLTTAPVAAFGFLGSNPGAITVQGSQLSVQPGQGIALVGGNITIQSGTLEDGTTQAAQLSAPGGRIHLASAASQGEFLAGTLEPSPNVNGQSFGVLGTIQVTQQSVIDASGDGGGTILIRGGRFVLDDSRISANTNGPPATALSGKPGAGIDIQVSQDAVIQNGAVLETNVTENVAPGIGSGGVRVKADRIEIVGILPNFNDPSAPPPPFTGIRSDVLPGSTGGKSGDIRLEANSILVKDFGQVETQVGEFGAPIPVAGDLRNVADAGHIALRTNQNIEINFGLITSTSSGSSGNSGNIELTSTNGNILMMTFPFVSTQTVLSSGNAGSLKVSAPNGDIILADHGALSNATRGTGTLGGIGIVAKNLQVLNESVISGDNFTTVNRTPGNITVTLSGSLNVDGNSTIKTTAEGPSRAAGLNITARDIRVSGASFLSTETFSSGPGGQLNIVAENVQLTNGGQIRSGSTINPVPPPSNLPPEFPSATGGTITIHGLSGPAASVLIDGVGSGIVTEAQGAGAGGNANIAAQSVTIQNGGTVSASTSGTAPSAIGGSIAISAGQFVTLNNGATITANSSGPANAGNIVINAGQNFTSTNSSVTTEAAQASGGNITVLASDLIHLTNSQINASVQGAQTTVGGNVTIDPNFVILQNSQILAQATQGQGGNISITTGSLLADVSSTIDASSQFGVSGNVTIQSPISQAGGKIIPLSKTTLETVALLSQRCAALASGQYSSFAVAGRDALPMEPGSWLTSPLIALSSDGGLPSSLPEALSISSADLAHAQDGFLVSLRRLPTLGARTTLLSTDWSEGCGS
jgi:filamentous hemagglutinin family protein